MTEFGSPLEKAPQPKRLLKPLVFTLGSTAKIVIAPHHDRTKGVLALLQKDSLSKWEATEHTQDFSIAKSPSNGGSPAIRDGAIPSNDLQIHNNGFSYEVGGKASADAFAERVQEVNGILALEKNAWAFVPLSEQPIIQVGTNPVRIEDVGGSAFVTVGKHRLALEEGQVITIGSRGDNNIVIEDNTGNPLDRTTLVCFNGKVFINSYDRSITVRTGADVHHTGPIENLKQTAAESQRQLQEEQGKMATAEKAITDLRHQIQQEQRRRTQVEQGIGAKDEKINLLQEEVRRLKSLAHTQNGTAMLGQFDDVLNGLPTDQQKEILRALKRGFNAQLHPDTNPNANVDPAILAKVNAAFDKAVAALRRKH